MENPTEWIGLLILVSIIIYSIFLVIITWLLVRKQTPSEKIQIDDGLKMELKKDITSRNEIDAVPKTVEKFDMFSLPVEAITSLQLDYKKDKLPLLQERIEKAIIPQLENKVVNPSELLEFTENRFLNTWVKGSMQRFSTHYRLTTFHNSYLIFDNLGNIKNEFKEGDEKLAQKLENLKDNLKDYDMVIYRFLLKIYNYYQDGEMDNWQNLGELHFYKLFNVQERLRRIGHKANDKKLSKSKKLKKELEKQKDEINKTANELIIRCYDIILWKKEIPPEIKRKINKIKEERGRIKIITSFDDIFKKYKFD